MIIETDSLGEMSSQAPGSMASFAFAADQMHKLSEVEVVIEQPDDEELGTPGVSQKLQNRLSEVEKELKDEDIAADLSFDESQLLYDKEITDLVR